MGFIRKLTGADAAKRAATVQADSGQASIDHLKEQLGLARSDLQPFREAGLGALDEFTRLLSDPRAQQDVANQNPLFGQIMDFQRTAEAPNFDASGLTNFDPINDNPLMDMAMDETSRRLMETQAARGRLGSGSTVVDLNKALAGTANSLANDEFNRRRGAFASDMLAESEDFDNAVLQDNQAFQDLLQQVAVQQGLIQDQTNRFGTLVNTGMSASGASAGATQGTGSQVANLITQIGNAEAGGLVGASNANKAFLMDMVKLAASMGTGGMPSFGGGSPPPDPNMQSKFPWAF